MSTKPTSEYNLTHIDVEHQDLVPTIRMYRKMDIPLIIFGPPGIGKSESVQQVLEEDDTLIDLRASMLDPVDVRGVPIVDREGGRVIWSRPDFWPQTGKGIIFFDELNTAPPSVQNTLLQPFGTAPGRPRYVGPHMIPASYYLMAASNRKSDFAHVMPMSAPLRNRVHILHVGEPSIENWTRWAVKNDVHPYVVGFLNFRSKYLFAPTKDEYDAFPTPRSWTQQVSVALKHGYHGQSLWKGAVGSAAATEFQTYITNLKDMPDIDRLLEGTIDYNFNEAKVSVIYAIVVELVFRAQRDPARILSKAMKVVDKLKPEYGAIFVVQMLHSEDRQVKAHVIANKDMTAWAQKHRTLITATGPTKRAA